MHVYAALYAMLLKHIMPKSTETDNVARFVFLAEQVCEGECMCVRALTLSVTACRVPHPISLCMPVPACECQQEVGHVEDPDDGLFWMEWSEAVNYFWSFTVCKIDAGGKRTPPPVSDSKRQARQAKQQMSRFDRVRHATSSTRLAYPLNSKISNPQTLNPKTHVTL